MAVDNLTCSQRRNPTLREQMVVRATGGDLGPLEHYLNSGGGIDARDEDGLALIHHAACHGNIPLIRELREHGADLDLLDDGSPPWKPIHYAIFHRKHEAEEVLRALGAEVPLPILKRITHENPASQKSEAWQTKFGSTVATWRRL